MVVLQLVPGTKTGSFTLQTKSRQKNRVVVNTGAIGLQIVPKDMLNNQDSLTICMARFASLCVMIRAHPKRSLFQLPL